MLHGADGGVVVGFDALFIVEVEGCPGATCIGGFSGCVDNGGDFGGAVARGGAEVFFGEEDAEEAVGDVAAAVGGFAGFVGDDGEGVGGAEIIEF